MASALALVIFPALLQMLLHPILSGGSIWTWAAFWIYTTFGVLVPGTLLAVRTLSWRADLLCWLGIGWALGHCVELLALLLARQLGDGRLGLLWAPLAYAYAYAFAMLPRAKSSGWSGTIDAVPQLGRCIAALVLLTSLGGGIFFAISLPEISTSPPFISDPWFHVSNAHEFRDHAPMGDRQNKPRFQHRRY
jgi:hypothetical protein